MWFTDRACTDGVVDAQGYEAELIEYDFANKFLETQQHEHGREPAPANFRSVPMPKKPIKIEVVQEGDERFLLKIFADGGEEREAIVKLPRKPPRFPYRKVTFDKSKKKGF